MALTAFTVASVLCGIAQSPTELVGARFLQGFTAAMMLAQTLAIITTTFPAEQRGKVFGIYGATIGMATILGPTLGGALIAWNVFGLEWRAIFLANVPFGIVALIFGYRNLLDSRSESAQRLDVPGVVLSVLGLFLIVYPLAEGRERGWPLWLVLMLIASAPVLVGFVWYQWRRGRANNSPLLDLVVFRDRAFSVGSLMALLFFSCLISFFFTISLTLQAGFGFTALHSGLTTLPFAVGSAIASARSNGIAQRLGSRILMLGAGVFAVGLVALSVVMQQQGTTPHWLVLAGPLFVAGIGLGLFIAPLQTVILSGVKQDNAGSASGLLPTFQQLGGSVGLAAVGVLFHVHRHPGAERGGPGQLRAEPRTRVARRPCRGPTRCTHHLQGLQRSPTVLRRSLRCAARVQCRQRGAGITTGPDRRGTGLGGKAGGRRVVPAVAAPHSVAVRRDAGGRDGPLARPAQAHSGAWRLRVQTPNECSTTARACRVTLR